MPRGGRRDLLAQERRAARRSAPSSSFSVDVPGEAVGDEDVGRAAQHVAALGVAGEVEALGASREQRVRLERELVALLGLLADREQAARAGRSTSRISCGEDRAHDRELEQVLGPAVGVRAGVDQDARRRCASGSGRRSRAASRPAAAAGGSRPAASIAPVFPAETTASALPSATARTAAHERRVGLRAHGLGRLVGHLDPVRGDRRARARPCRDRPGRRATTSMPSAAASSAPATTSPGARSPPSASTAIRGLKPLRGAKRSGSTSRPL